jgi:hypothetical protein
MPRALSRRQSRQNAAFIAALRGTGNARLAALALGVNRSTYTKRRSKHPAFAAEWDAALAAAHARIDRDGGGEPPQVSRGGGEGPRVKRGGGAGPTQESSFRTRGGEPVVVRTASGRLQLRRSPPGRMTAAAEKAFFEALSGSCNVRLSAAAASFAHSSFYARKRSNAAFAREMKVALSIGYDRLEMAAIERASYNEADIDEHDELGWRERIAANPLPPMTVHDALMLLRHHRNTMRLGWDHRDHQHQVATNAEVRRALEAALRKFRHQKTGSWRRPGEG